MKSLGKPGWMTCLPRIYDNCFCEKERSDIIVPDAELCEPQNSYLLQPIRITINGTETDIRRQ